MISSSCRAEFVHESTTKALSAHPGQVRIGVKSGRGGYDFVTSALAESRHCPRGPNWVWSRLKISKSKTARGSDAPSHNFRPCLAASVDSRVWFARANPDGRGRIDTRLSATIRPWASTAARWKLSGRPRPTLRPPPGARRMLRCPGRRTPDSRLEQAPSPANALAVRADDWRRACGPASFPMGLLPGLPHHARR